MTAAGAYFADHEYYPESLDALNNNYIPRQETVQKFKENFEYTYTGKIAATKIKLQATALQAKWLMFPKEKENKYVPKSFN